MRAQLTVLSGTGAMRRAELASYLTPAQRDLARSETNRWIKTLRHADYDGRSMRERFAYRGDALWWFTELYLQKMRRLDAAVAAVLALESVVEAHEPAGLILEHAEPAVAAAATAFGRARGIPVELRQSKAAAREAWSAYLVGLTARLSRLRPARPPRVERRPTIAAFVHTAFWSTAGDVDDPRQEQYIGPVLEAVGRDLGAGELFFVGVGPRRNFRSRRWWDPMTPAPGARPPITPVERFASTRALSGSLALWRDRRALARALTSGDSIRALARFRGCDLWSVLEPELAGAAMVQWPWSARAMDEAGAALDALAPDIALTYAEAGGWGRAMVLESRRRGIRSVGLQHGFIYRHWLNYLHEPDEFEAAGADAGCPIPDRTLVFDRYALDHLTTAGRFPSSKIVVTGNPRLDALAGRMRTVDRAERDRLRLDIGASPGQTLLVLAAKFSEIRDELPALAEAVGHLPDLLLAIRPHPAETAQVYAPLLAGRGNIRLTPATLSLAHALAAADALVTMNSTVAIDGLSLGLPSLVIGLPNNLSPFVDAGVMLGADAASGVRAALESLLYDQDVRARLAGAARAFVDEAGMRPQGDAARRASAAIRTGWRDDRQGPS